MNAYRDPYSNASNYSFWGLLVLDPMQSRMTGIRERAMPFFRNEQPSNYFFDTFTNVLVY